MPYIKRSDKDDLINGRDPQTPGELNYIFSVFARNYFEKFGNYQAINDIVGALEGAKLEFYRRMAAPYEDKKIIENGDVYN